MSRGWVATILHASAGKYGIPGFASFLCINRDINSRNKGIGRAPLEEKRGRRMCVRTLIWVFPGDREAASIRTTRLTLSRSLSLSLSVPTRVHIKLRLIRRDLMRLDLNSFIYYRSTLSDLLFCASKRGDLIKLRDNCVPFFAAY